jgi:hypothetical protein
MYNFIPNEHGKIQIQTLTHGYQDCLVPDIFQNIKDSPRYGIC